MSKKSLMFDFITDTSNPLGGHCYGCNYCYIHGVKGMKIRFKHIRDKYRGKHRLYEKELNKRFKEGDFVFFCDCIDYLHPDVSDEFIRRIYEWISRNRLASFLSLTKNPIRYLDFEMELPINMFLGATIESNRDYPIISKAQLQYDRIKAMHDIANNVNIFHYRRMISCEPILKFDLGAFLFNLQCILRTRNKSEDFIVIGYDNHKNRLNEPSLSDTLALIELLEEYNIKVIRKSIRKAWWEK